MWRRAICLRRGPDRRHAHGRRRDQASIARPRADRAPVLAEPVAPTQTIAIHVDRLPGHLGAGAGPAHHERRTAADARLLFQLKSAERKLTVACEPVRQRADRNRQAPAAGPLRHLNI